VDARDGHTLAAAILDRSLDVLDHDEGVVHVDRRLGERRVRGFPQHFLAARIHRDDAPGIAVLAQVALRARCVLGRVARRAAQRPRGGAAPRAAARPPPARPHGAAPPPSARSGPAPGGASSRFLPWGGAGEGGGPGPPAGGGWGGAAPRPPAWIATRAARCVG